MATLAVQTISQAGLNPVFADATAGGDKVQPGPGVYLDVRNNSAAATTVTIATQRASNYGDSPNVAVVVPSGQHRKIAVSDSARFAAADGLAVITYSAVVSIAVGAFRA